MAWGKTGVQVTHFEEGPEGRALFATVVTGVGNGSCKALRVGVVYGVSGGDSHSLPTHKQELEQRVNRFVCQEVRRAVERNMVPLVGGDVNSVDNPALDARGTTAVHREESLVSSLLATGMLDTFRIHHPTMQAVSRCGPGGKGNRIDCILVWPSEEAECVAAGIHLDHKLYTDHRTVMVDLDRARLEEEEEEEEVQEGRPQWRGFRQKYLEAVGDDEKMKEMRDDVLWHLGEGCEEWVKGRTGDLQNLRRADVRSYEVRELLGKYGHELEDAVLKVVREMAGECKGGKGRKTETPLTETLTKP